MYLSSRLPVLEQVLSEYDTLAGEGMDKLGTQALIHYYEEEL
jgi:hypothetical protein